LARTKKTCAAHAERLELREFDLAARDWRRLEPAPDAICSSLAVHHLDGCQKQQLFKDLLAALRPGGIFVLADLVRPESPAGWRIAAEDWDRAVAERSLQIYGDDRAKQKFAELRWNYFSWPHDNTIDHPSSVAEHFSWLESAGFQAIELHWLIAGHAIFSARKP
jgi:tRNA (cmo5U34)-methyltransferase